MQEYTNTTSGTQFWVAYTNTEFLVFGELQSNSTVSSGQSILETFNTEQELSDRLGILSGDVDYYNKWLTKNPKPENYDPSYKLQMLRENMTTSPWKFRLALTELGLRDQVESVVAAADQNTKDAWEYATSFDRLNPLVIQFGSVLLLTEEEIDNVFKLANTL